MAGFGKPNLRSQVMDESETVMLSQDKTRVPLTNIHRLLKRGIPPYGKASKDAKQAVQDLLQEFIGFVTREAKGISKREKRKVLGGDDILIALENLGMRKYSEILKEYQKTFRKSVAERSFDSDAESAMLAEIVENDTDLNPHECKDRANYEALHDPPSDHPSQAYKSLRHPPLVKTKRSSSNVGDSRPSLMTLQYRSKDENVNPNVTEDVEKDFISKEFGTTKLRHTAASVHHVITIPPLTIPAAFISGIRIPEIDIPELTVPVELVVDHQTANTSGQANLGLQEEEHRPNTEVVDLVSPSSQSPLQLLDSDILETLDLNSFLEEESIMETTLT